MSELRFIRLSCDALERDGATVGTDCYVKHGSTTVTFRGSPCLNAQKNYNRLGYIEQSFYRDVPKLLTTTIRFGPKNNTPIFL